MSVPWKPRRLRARSATLVALSILLLSACGPEEDPSAQQQEPPPPPVTVQTVSPQSVDVEQDYAGRVHGVREVEVRARVGGILEERLYREGQRVEQGDLLFRIDSEPFEAHLQEARAQRQSARADLEEAERDWRRISRLYERGAVSESERDRARSAVSLARAAVALAEAQVTRARLDRDYATVEAPVSGVTSVEEVPEGSLLERGTRLTRIVQHDPVHVRFALPESDAAVQRAARRALAAGDAGEHRHEAVAILADGSEYAVTGEIDFTDSSIDRRTGTVRARAVFDNPDGVLVPGQFLRVRVLLESLDGVFLVPESVISEGAEGPQLYVVDDGGLAQAVPVELGPVVGGRQVILDGLEDGARVIVNGHATVQPGAPVDVQDDNGESR